MSGSGTDKTKSRLDLAGPVIILVEPQLGENIGLAARASRTITFPVNLGFASLNLAQAVLLIGYEWFKLSTEGALPFSMPEHSERVSQHQMQAFFDNLVRELDQVEFLRPAEKRETMLVNLRNIFTRMEPTKQDMHTLHGLVLATS